MNMSSEIPDSPVPSVSTSMGWFPDVGLHSRRGVFVQESSYCMLWFAAFMFLVAGACCFIPWEERAFLGRGPKVIYFIAGGIAWGGICVVGGYWILNLIGQRITVDPHGSRVILRSSEFETEIPISNVIGIQLCGGDGKPYQANLVYSCQTGETVRHCLYSHASKRLCKRLARQYHVRCGFAVIDQTA